VPPRQLLHVDDVQPVRHGEVHRLERAHRVAHLRLGELVGHRVDAAEDVVRPYLNRWPKMDRNAIVQGWAGVYSSFLLHAETAAERYKVPAHAILCRCG